MNTKRIKLVAGAAACMLGLTASVHAALSTMPVIEPEAAEASAVSHDEKALGVIDAYIAKIGGEEIFATIQSTTMTATIEIPMAGLTGSMVMMSKSPDKVAMTMEIPGFGKTESGYNGEVGWSSDPMSGPRLLEGEEVDQLKRQADVARATRYRELYTTIAYAGETNFEGKKAHKIRLVDADGKETFEFFDVATSFMIGNEGTQASPMGEINVITVMEEYKEFGGMMVPTRMTNRIGPQQIFITISSVEINTVKDDAFKMPAAIQKLVEAKKDG